MTVSHAALLFVLLGLICTATVSAATSSAATNGEAVIAYVFVTDRVLRPDEISPSKVTRINYAFANLKNGQMVEGFSHDAENFATLIGLKAINPRLEVLISVGGWSWSGGFSDMAKTADSRAKFIDSAVAFIQKYKLDGVDVDWEYPGMPGIGNPHRAVDRTNYTALLKELRERLDVEEKHWNRPLITSIATGASAEFLEHTQMGQVAQYVNTVNLMTYDYYEPSSSALTGHHAPLFANAADPRHVSADQSVQDYLAAGVPAHKLVLGVPFYGHAWSGVAQTSHGLFQPGKPAKISANYRDITGSLLTSGYIRYWDPEASAPYLYNPATRIFVSYEDEESIKSKAAYVLQHKLAGMMFWEYHADSNSALLNAINTALSKR